MRPSSLVIQLRNLTVHRGTTRILNDVSWEVRNGEHWVVLGANGSGKTCLFGALTGYLTPSSGEITVLGEKYGASDWRELRKRIGFVSSSIRQMIPDHEAAMLTVISGKYAMVDYWGAVRKADRQDAERILRQVDAGNLATRAWGVLSQGERQRVLIGRALIARPALLILDEPCAGLDPFAREQFLGFLQQLGSRRERAGAGAGHASCGRDHAGVHEGASPEKRFGDRRRRETRGADLAKPIAGV